MLTWAFVCIIRSKAVYGDNLGCLLVIAMALDTIICCSVAYSIFSHH